jgi:hypothetical protein
MTIDDIISFMKWRGIYLKDVQTMNMPHLLVKKHYLFGRNMNGVYESMIITENNHGGDYTIKIEHNVGSKQHNYNHPYYPCVTDNFQEIYKKELRDYAISNLVNDDSNI